MSGERSLLWLAILLAALGLQVWWLRRRRASNGRPPTLRARSSSSFPSDLLHNLPGASRSRLARAAEVALVAASIAFVLAGQGLLYYASLGSGRAWGWLFGGGAAFVLLVVWGARNDPGRMGAPAAAPAAAGTGPVRAWLLAAGGLCSACLLLAYWHERAGGRFYWDALALWAGSLAAYLLAFRPPSRAWWRERLQAHRGELLLVAALTALAAMLRLLWLDQLPDVLNGDEGLHGLYARGVLAGEHTQPFSTFYGAGALHLFVVALGLKFLGNTELAARLVPALGGALGAPAIYLLARRLFGRLPAFVAGGLTAVLHAHVHFSRVLGVGYIYAALFAGLGVYLLYSAMEARSPRRAALGGVILGLWLHVYIDARLVPAALIAWLCALLAMRSERAFVLDNFGQLRALAGGYAVAAAPLAMWGLRNWDAFNQRFRFDGALWNGYYARLLAEEPAADVARTVAGQAAHVFLSLVRYRVGDFYQSPAPFLDLLSGALLWLALLYSLLRLRDRRHLLLNLWLWPGMAAVGVLTIPRSSDGYRLLIVFTPLVLMLANAAVYLARRLGGGWLACGILLGAILAVNVGLYFGDFARGCFYGGNRETRTAYFMGKALAGLTAGERAVVVGNARFRYGTHASAQYLNPGVEVENWLAPLRGDALRFAPPRLFLLIPERQGDLAALQAAYPGGRISRIDDCRSVALHTYSPP